MFNLSQKLKSCKEALKVWSKKTFGNNKLNINSLNSTLSSLRIQPFSEDCHALEKEIKEELEVIMLREEMYLHQRSRLNWISYGDKKNACFHASVTQRRQRNQLIKIKDSECIWITEEGGINNHLFDHFSTLFKPSGRRRFDLCWIKWKTV